MRNAEQIASALVFIDKAMEQSEFMAKNVAQEHFYAFRMQMREKLGVEEFILNELYLPMKLARFQSQYLGRMENIKRAIVSEKTSRNDNLERKAFDDDEPLIPQVESLLERETNLFSLEAMQELDSARQQAFGINQYIWEGGDCPLCSAYNGQIFTWGEGDEPGDVHPNCNCSADPILDGAGSVKVPEITAPIVTEAGNAVVIHHPKGAKETRTGGTRAWRNNNPGNIRAGKFADQYGAIGAAGGFAVFPDEKTGAAASEALLRTATYSKLTIDEAIARRSPSNENDTVRLQNDIRKIGGFSGDEVIGELNYEEMSRLIEAIKRTEGWKVGNVLEEP